MPVTLHTRIRPKSGPHDPIPDRREDMQETGESYEAAYETLRARVPEGWVMLRVERE